MREHYKGKQAEEALFPVVDARKTLRAINSAAQTHVQGHGLRATFASVAEGLVSAAVLKRMKDHAVTADVTLGHYVAKSAYVDGDRVLVDVKDNCGGLPAGAVGLIFKPFTQGGNNRNGLGLSLSIAKRSVEASGGALRVRDVPGIGCIFTMDLARQKLR